MLYTASSWAVSTCMHHMLMISLQWPPTSHISNESGTTVTEHQWHGMNIDLRHTDAWKKDGYWCGWRHCSHAAPTSHTRNERTMDILTSVQWRPLRHIYRMKGPWIRWRSVKRRPLSHIYRMKGPWSRWRSVKRRPLSHIYRMKGPWIRWRRWRSVAPTSCISNETTMVMLIQAAQLYKWGLGLQIHDGRT